jgi:glycine betaine/choline ABC-type transport system substrate-binding protein
MRARRIAVAFVALLIAGCATTTGAQSMAVGARAGDPESVLLANLYASALRSHGTPAHVEATPDPLAGLDSADITVVPGFTGRLLDTFAAGAPARAPAQVYRDLLAALPEGVAAGDYAESAEDKPAIAVTEATADAWGGRDVSAAVRNCSRLRLGKVIGAQRQDALGPCKADTRGFASAAMMFDALRTGQVNAVWTSTTNPDIPVDAVVLTDRTSVILAENVVPLYRRNALSEVQTLAINEVAGVLDTAALVQMRRQLATGADPGQIADGYFAEHPLGATS